MLESPGSPTLTRITEALGLSFSRIFPRSVIKPVTEVKKKIKKIVYMLHLRLPINIVGATLGKHHCAFNFNTDTTSPSCL